MRIRCPAVERNVVNKTVQYYTAVYTGMTEISGQRVSLVRKGNCRAESGGGDQ